MVRIKRRTGVIHLPGAKLLFLFVCAATVIRLLSAAGADELLQRVIKCAAQNPNFVHFAIASETVGIPVFNSDSENELITVFRSQSPFYTLEPTTPEQVRAAALKEAEFKNSLVPWTYTAPPTKAKKEFPIKAVSINPQSSNGYTTLGKIYLKNDSSKTIDLNAYLKADMPFSLKGDGPHVLIVHTHGSESYFPSGKYTYTQDDVERTQDKRYNVIRVGDEIEKILKENGISVVHDRNIYDSPSYNGSYTRTLDAISAQMQKTPSIKVVLDIHRDAMTTAAGVKYKTSATVNGKPSAQLMLVMSTGESGLPHPNWQENLKFAVKLQCQIVNKYPGLMRPINLRTERFNMHVTTGSMLVEVGTSANSMDEALTAIRPFSEELARLLNSVRKK